MRAGTTRPGARAYTTITEGPLEGRLAGVGGGVPVVHRPWSS